MGRILDWFRRNVKVDTVEWEAVASATLPVWRHKACGELVRDAFLSEHLRTKHDRVVVATIRMFNDGMTEIDMVRDMVLEPKHVQGIFTFLGDRLNDMTRRMIFENMRELQQAADKVRSFPGDKWVN